MFVKYFWFKPAEIQGIPVAVARSGWSKQGGFEIYLMDGRRGTDLWNIVREAGQPYGIGPGNPNWVERIESGLVSYGGDTDDNTNPFEVRMGRYVDLDVADDVIGIAALRKIAAKGPLRQQLGVILNGGEPEKPGFTWHDIHKGGRKIGDLTNCAWSYRLKKNIGFALVSASALPGEPVTVTMHDRPVAGTLCELPFL